MIILGLLLARSAVSRNVLIKNRSRVNRLASSQLLSAFDVGGMMALVTVLDQLRREMGQIRANPQGVWPCRSRGRVRPNIIKHLNHRVRGGAYSETLKVRMQERILEVEADAVKCGGYFRLRSGSAD